MRRLPVPAFQAAPEEPILCTFEPQSAPGAFPGEVVHRVPAGRKAVRPRVEYYYRQLKALPRRVRRALARRYARSLAGVALLLALGQAPVLAATIEVDGTSCALVDAIKAANTDVASGNCSAGSGADTLVLLANGTHTLTTVQDTTYGLTGLPLVTSQITIAGNNSTIERGAGAPEFRILAVGEAGNLTLQALTVSGGHAVYVEESPTYSEYGGGVFNRFGTLTLTNGTVSGNKADYIGGGVFSSGCLTLTNSTVSDNTGRFCAGVSNGDGTLTLTNSTVSGNTAIGSAQGGAEGGGLSNNAGTMTIVHSIITANAASYPGFDDGEPNRGGGVFNGGGTVTITDSTVAGNTVVNGGILYGGGGVYNGSSGTLTLTNSMVSGNTAAGAGGGVLNFFGGTLTLTNSAVFGNTANGYYSSGDGGGVANNGSGTLTLTNSTVSGNTARCVSYYGYDCVGGNGGGVANNGSGALTLTNSTVSGNTAAGGGGGVLNLFGSLTATNSTISGNSAVGKGGGVYNPGYYSDYSGNFYAGTLTLAHSLISGNTAPNGAETHNYTGPHGSATIHADNFNLFGTSGDAGVVGFTPGPTDIVPAAGVTLADILGPFANNGGPTQTHALVFGSPAIDASPIDKECAVKDQRGVFRPQGPACDIGAFEVGVEPDPFASPTPTAGCTVNGVPDQLCRGTAGPDRILGTAGNDVILGLEGDDDLNGSRGDDRLFGGEENDRLIGGKGDDQLFGQEGDDDLRGYSGNDQIEGGDGDDRLKGHEGDDRLLGGEGDDALRGLEGEDTLEGGAGSDLLRGGGGTDTLNGGPGADRLNGGGGTDGCASDAEDNLVVLCE